MQRSLPGTKSQDTYRLHNGCLGSNPVTLGCQSGRPNHNTRLPCSDNPITANKSYLAFVSWVDVCRNYRRCSTESTASQRRNVKHGTNKRRMICCHQGWHILILHQWGKQESDRLQDCRLWKCFFPRFRCDYFSFVSRSLQILSIRRSTSTFVFNSMFIDVQEVKCTSCYLYNPFFNVNVCLEMHRMSWFMPVGSWRLSFIKDITFLMFFLIRTS